MIAEAYNGADWGSPHAAAIARSRRAAKLREEGYEVFTRNLRALNTTYNSYELVALEPSEVRVRPAHPFMPQPKG